MSRLHPRIFSEIAISLIPLANAPTWVKALWVEKELEARGLWRDDVFDLVRPFLVSSKNTGQNKDQPEIQGPISASGSIVQPVEPRPEIRVSKPLLSEAEAKWSPSFDHQDGPSDEDAAGEPAVADGPPDPTAASAYRPADEEDQTPDAELPTSFVEYHEPDDISVPELWQPKLRTEDLTPEQAELASVMHLIAVSTRLDDDTELELPEESPQDEADGGIEIGRDEHGADDFEPPVDVGAVEPVKPDVPVEVAPARQTEEEIPTEFIEIEQVEAISVVEIDESRPDVDLWSEARRPEQEILDQFQISNDLEHGTALPAPVELEPEVEDETAEVSAGQEPAPDVVLWSEPRSSEEDVQSAFGPADQLVVAGDAGESADPAAVPESEDRTDTQEADPSESPEVILWSENRRPEYEIAGEFNSPVPEPVPAPEPAVEEIELVIERETEAVVEPDVAAPEEAVPTEIILWSEARKAEDEILRQFEQPALLFEDIEEDIKPVDSVDPVDKEAIENESPEVIAQPTEESVVAQSDEPVTDSSASKVGLAQTSSPKRRSKSSKKITRTRKPSSGSKQQDTTAAKANKPKKAASKIGPVPTLETPVTPTAVTERETSPRPRQTAKPTRATKPELREKVSVTESEAIDKQPRSVKPKKRAARPAASPAKKAAPKKTAEAVQSEDAPDASIRKSAVKPVKKLAKPVRAAAATSDSKKTAHRPARKSPATAKPKKKPNEPKIVAKPVSPELAEQVARIKQEKRAKAAERSKRLRNQTSQKAIDSIRRKLNSQKTEHPKEPLKDMADAADAAGIADFYGLHIDGATKADRAKLLFFASVLKSQQGDWDGSDEQLRTALDALDDSMQTRIWKRVIEQSMRIHDQIDRSAA